MNPNPTPKDPYYAGYGLYFEGQRLGIVIDDRVKPVSWLTMTLRVITLDHGATLRDPSSEPAAAEGFILRSPAEEEELRSRLANALHATPVVGEEEGEAAYADHLCLA